MSELIAFYGSLRPGSYDRMAPDPGGLVEHVGRCRIAGRLYDLGPFPGLVRTGGADDQVIGDLFRITSDRALAAFDAWEDYVPDDPEGSLYLRQLIRLIDPQVDAWVYIWNASSEPYDLISGGDWQNRPQSART